MCASTSVSFPFCIVLSFQERVRLNTTTDALLLISVKQLKFFGNSAVLNVVNRYSFLKVHSSSLKLNFKFLHLTSNLFGRCSMVHSNKKGKEVKSYIYKRKESLCRLCNLYTWHLKNISVITGDTCCR